MKKTIILFATLSIICSASALTYASTTEANATVQRISSSWEYRGTVTIKKRSGNMWISNQNHRVEQNSETGRLRIEYGDSWYNVSDSDRSGFDYMFSTGRSVWYFNL